MSGTLLIVVHGTPSEKRYEGAKKTVSPFVAAKRMGTYSDLGIGFKTKSGSQFWGVRAPHAIIHAWRAMKILEQIPTADGALVHCWYAAEQHIHDLNKHHLDSLARFLDDGEEGKEKLDHLRNEILKSAPSPNELEEAIYTLEEEGIPFAAWEIKEEIAAGRVASTDFLQGVIQAEEDRLSVRERQAEEAASVIQGGSFDELLADLGITGLITGRDSAGVWDWNDIPSIDAHLRDNAGDLELQQRLENKSGQAVGTRPAQFTDAEGTIWVFTSARYSAQIFVAVSLQRKGATKVIKTELSIAELRGQVKIPFLLRVKKWTARLLKSTS
jgi:hypothetical protein